MNSLEIESRVRMFFDDFVEAFFSFNGEMIAERYLSPYLAFHSHGSVQIFMSKAEIATYFQRVVDGYSAKGCRSCRYNDMTILPLGRECALGTVTWELLAEDGSILNAWRESYNLCAVEGRYMVFASTDHDS